MTERARGPGSGVAGMLCVLGLTLTASAAPVAAQSCGLLPIEENRLWVGVGVAGGAPETSYDLRAGFDFFDRVVAQVGLGWGGWDTGGDAATFKEVAVGLPLQRDGLHACPLLFAAQMRASFLERFDAARGEMRDLRAGVRLPLGGAVADAGGVTVRWLASVDVGVRRWHQTSRDVVVDETVRLERDEDVRYDALVEGMAGVQGRIGTVGLTLGVAHHQLVRRRWMPFVQLALRAG